MKVLLYCRTTRTTRHTLEGISEPSFSATTEMVAVEIFPRYFRDSSIDASLGIGTLLVVEKNGPEIRPRAT